MELAAVAHGRRAVRVQRVLAREVDEERGARLREAQRAVVRRDHVRVHRGLHALRESAVAARRACTPRAGVQKREQRGRVLDDAEAVRRGACVEHAVPCLYAAAHSDARGSLEDALRGLVLRVPVLMRVAEGTRHADEGQLPRRV